MSLTLKPHTVEVHVPEEDVNAQTKSVGVLGFSDEPSLISCKVEPMSPVTVFEQTGIETKRPHRIMCEIADSASFRENAKVVWALGDLTFRVKTKQNFNAFPDTAHCVVMVDIEGDTP